MLLAGTLQMFQGRATPSGGVNRRPKRPITQNISVLFARRTQNLGLGLSAQTGFAPFSRKLPRRTETSSRRIQNTLILGLALTDCTTAPDPEIRSCRRCSRRKPHLFEGHWESG